MILGAGSTSMDLLSFHIQWLIVTIIRITALSDISSLLLCIYQTLVPTFWSASLLYKLLSVGFLAPPELY
jgi:hypothetical protein